MPQIIPIKELKNTSVISDMVHKSQEPIYVTKNGFGDMVIMSMEIFEEMHSREQIYKDLAISERQFKEGKTKDARAALSQLKKKYDL